MLRNRRSSMLGSEAVSAGSGASSGNLRAAGSPKIDSIRHGVSATLPEPGFERRGAEPVADPEV